MEFSPPSAVLFSLSKSCLRDEAFLGIKTESPKANYDTSMRRFECSRNYSDNVPGTAPTPHPSPHHCPLLFCTQRQVSGHIYEVNIASFKSEMFVVLTADQFVGREDGLLEQQKQDSHICRRHCTFPLILTKNQIPYYKGYEVYETENKEWNS